MLSSSSPLSCYDAMSGFYAILIHLPMVGRLHPQTTLVLLMLYLMLSIRIINIILCFEIYDSNSFYKQMTMKENKSLRLCFPAGATVIGLVNVDEIPNYVFPGNTLQILSKLINCSEGTCLKRSYDYWSSYFSWDVCQWASL